MNTEDFRDLRDYCYDGEVVPELEEVITMEKTYLQLDALV